MPVKKKPAANAKKLIQKMAVVPKKAEVAKKAAQAPKPLRPGQVLRKVVTAAAIIGRKKKAG